MRLAIQWKWVQPERRFVLRRTPGTLSALLFALEALGVSERLVGQLAASDGTLRRVLSVVRETGVGVVLTARILANLASVQWQLGSTEAALAAANEAVETAHSGGAQIFECLACLIRGRVQRTAGLEADATAELHAALELARGTGAVTYEPFVLEELARLQRDEKALADVLRLYRQIGATGHVRRLEAELGAEV